MLNVSDELKQAFLRDGSHKNLTVQFEQDFDWINFYSGGVATAESTYTANNKTMFLSFFFIGMKCKSAFRTATINPTCNPETTSA